MISLMMLIENQRETQILKMAFEQMRFKPLLSKPSYSNYIKTLQYVPDVILMEMPKMNNEQLHFARLIKKHRKTRNIPLIAYGDETDPALKRGMFECGIENYLDRPLKFSQLLKIIETRLKQLNKSVEIKAKTESAGEKEQDIELILDPDTLPTKKVELVVKHIAGLMAFPFTVAKVLQLAGAEQSGASDLAKVIEADPVITTNVLKVANSVFFASMNRRISSIKDSIVRIGFRETKRIVMGMSVMELFETEARNAGFDRVDYWYNSLATALFSERVAKRMGNVNPEEAFLGGLLHDFGLLLMDEFFPTIFEKILELTTNEGTSFNEASIRLMGISHTDIVAELFELWKIPPTLAEAMTSQYSICEEKNPLDTPGKKIALCIAVGSLLSKCYRFGALCDQYVIAFDRWVWEEAKMATGPGKRLVEGVQEEFRMYRQFLRLEDRGGAGGRGRGPAEDELLHVGVVDLADQVFLPFAEYLSNVGHEVQSLSASESYASHDGLFDVIIAWAGSDTTVEQVDSLTNVIQRTKGESWGDQAPPTVPVLVLVTDQSSLPRAAELGEISFMHQDHDLRLLEANLSLILEGERITAEMDVETSAAPVAS